MKKRNGLDSLNEEQKEIMRFVIIVIAIGLIVGIIYLISYFTSLKNEYHYDEVTSGSVNDSIVTVGTMFNRADNEYYVALYKDDDVEAVYYSALINKYSSKEDALKVYYANLNNKLNEEYYVGNEQSNSKAKTIDDLKLGDFTFVKIKNGKITKYLETVDAMKEELGV